MKRFIVFLIIASIIILPAYGEILTLREAIEIALENNYSIKTFRKLSDVAKNNATFGNSGMLPKIDAVAGMNYSNTNIDMELDVGPQPMEIKKDGNAQKSIMLPLN